MSMRAVCIVVAYTVAASACSSARRSEPFASERLPQTAEIQRGAQVFHRHCHQCHTGGEAALAPAINNKPLPGFMLRLQTRRGLGAMPAFPESKISDDELDDLVAYLKALRAKT